MILRLQIQLGQLRLLDEDFDAWQNEAYKDVLSTYNWNAGSSYTCFLSLSRRKLHTNHYPMQELADTKQFDGIPKRRLQDSLLHTVLACCMIGHVFHISSTEEIVSYACRRNFTNSWRSSCCLKKRRLQEGPVHTLSERWQLGFLFPVFVAEELHICVFEFNTSRLAGDFSRISRVILMGKSEDRSDSPFEP